MIYVIDEKYYVNISPSIYVEVIPQKVGANVLLKPTKNKIEVPNGAELNKIDINTIKENIIKKENKSNIQNEKLSTKNKFSRKTKK